MKSLFVLSYGGGVNSSALFFHLFETGRPLDLVIFADTQEETPATYDAVARMKVLCAEEASLVYYDHPVCEDHWAQHCEGVINLKNTFDIKEGAPSGHN